MIKIIITSICIALFLNGCFSNDVNQKIKENRIDIGDIKINYYADKSVASLIVPPDLTEPSYQNSFRLSEYVDNIDPNIIDLGNATEPKKEIEKILVPIEGIRVKKSGNRRWLEVDKDIDFIWNLSKQFLKEKGFVLKKVNNKIGVMETDFLENKKPDIPATSMGWIRSMLQSTIENVNYTLPTVDSYMIRVEPISENTTQVHLSINSMAEVITGVDKNRHTLWQKQERNIPLETEMLYSLMVFLGGDEAASREKIINSQEDNKIDITLLDGFNGYAKIRFNLPFLETWDNLSWAITQMDIDIYDRDLKERTIYIKTARTADKGIWSKIFDEGAINQTFQLQLKQIDSNYTEVYFVDISEENEKETKDFSYEFLERILKSF